jgi:hypothetical protein
MSRAARASDSDIALADVMRQELERERLRADRAIAYGARLLLQLDALEQLLREYGAHHADCIDLDPTAPDTNCSCGLRAHIREVDTWRVEMTAP